VQPCQEDAAVKLLAIALLVTSSLLSTIGVVRAQQDVPVRFQGRVVWVSGQRLVVIPDGSIGINVDISQVPQDQHGFLREGDRVIVTGTVLNPRNRVVAGSIVRLGQ
jgi:hypothetical protein